MYHNGLLTSLTRAKNARSLRASSWDTTGRNADAWRIEAGETKVLADIKGPGCINHIWMTVHPDYWRYLILRMYWDGEESPSIEVPLGDFFCNGWCERCNVNSLPVSVNPAGGFNCYWEMPFRKSARITLENLTPQVVRSFFFPSTNPLFLNFLNIISFS